ncbi:class D beta-lactamase [Duganella sp. BJB488]|nr:MULTISPECIES: class D beta-lactamase [unclassified Duganella]RFP25840.1 class D beta-lactamase [Duganella sp. BJB489]RFP28419.1 class D beta-lactamase [Duganella sp. BJB488]RFP36771.1 class D beta-lactamase [Duganella sp. BJB480]
MFISTLLMFRFLLASLGCLAAGLLVWVLTAACRRYLPQVAVQRSIWLLGQVTIVATFLAFLLPQSERLRLLPPIELPETMLSAPVAPDHAAVPAQAGAIASAGNTPTDYRTWLNRGAEAWLSLYLLGLAYTTGRVLQAHRTLNGLAATGEPLILTGRHQGLDSAAPPPSLTVIEVDAPISPMLFGWFRPRLLLPRHLRSFEPLQQQMIVEHELTHLRRHDLQWMSAGVVLQTLLWFNPFMRLLRDNLAWAQELGCDRDVLRNRPPSQRKAYAAALVAQLRLQPHPVTHAAKTALAFGVVSARTVAARVGLIREPAAAPRGVWARGAAVAGLAGIFAASLAFQPALADRAAPAAHAATPATFSCTDMVDAATGARLVHDGHCDERVTPASTFNIAVSLMGYDSGILRDAHSPSLPFKPGYIDWNPDWRETTDPTSWIRNSTVWYAQQVTASLGARRFQQYLNNFGYGNLDTTGDPGKDNGLSMSWIESSLKISPAEQTAFLRKIVNRQLPLSAHAYDMTARITALGTLPNGWQIHGKTGTASPVLADGSDDARRSYGWFVGWATKDGRTVVFSRLVLQDKQDRAAGPATRDAFLHDLPARLDAL